MKSTDTFKKSLTLNQHKMETIFKQLFSKTNDFVTSYKTDFEHDKKAIENSSNCPFVHIARSYGTSLSMFRQDLSFFPKKGELVPYLFGTADRNRILKDSVYEIEYYSNATSTEFLIHYFDGQKLVKIDFKKAIELKNEYLKKVLNIWEQEEITNLKSV